jgi:hypothetical protein
MGNEMNRFERVAGPVMATMALLVLASAAGCGGGGGGGGGTPDPVPVVTPVDKVLPTVSGTIHLNGATNVPLNTKVGATFSEAMDPATINTTSLFLMQGTTLVPGTVSYTGVSAVLAPSALLLPGMPYIVTVKGGAGGVKDLAGNALASDYRWTWTTGLVPDILPPTVTGTVNADGATNVAVNTKVGATFSEGMDPLTISTATLFLMQGTTAVPGRVTFSGVSALFVPSANLAPGTRYTVTVKGGAGGVRDLAANPLASDYVWSWTTGAGSDAGAPTVAATSIANGAVNVAIDTIVSATMSEAMDPLTITNLNCTLRETATGALALAGTVSYAAGKIEIKLDIFGPIPSSLLLPNTAYTVTLKGGAGGIEDLAGNPMANDFAWSFTTAGTSSPKSWPRP